MTGYQIGEITRQLGLSADTLRYYEKIGVIPPVARTSSGMRVYEEKDIGHLRFIQRAKKMNFTLAEISALLKMRDNPRQVRGKVRTLTQRKLREIEINLVELTGLRDELRLLLNLCNQSREGCPIIERIEAKSSFRPHNRRRTSR